MTLNHDRWLVSYADFITLLFAFFTTLYAISVVDQEKGQRLVHSIRESFGTRLLQLGREEPGLVRFDPHDPVPLGDEAGAAASRREAAQMAMLKERVENLSESRLLEQGVQARQTQEGLVISLAATQFFPTGTSELSDAARETIHTLARLIDDLPNYIRVEGHTDDRPVSSAAVPSNWHLSAYRAVTVVRELEKAGIPSYRLSAAGFADQRPLLSNRTPEGRARNRRVDLVILRTQLGRPRR
ncbi:MAG: OmpA family protein [Myxococcota bacterium]